MSPLNKLTAAPRLNGRLAAYATLAGVALAAPAVSKADIVYSGPVNIIAPSTTSGVYLNVVTGVFNTAPASAPGWDVNPWGTTTLGLFSPTNPTGGAYVITATNIAQNMAVGTPISAANLFGSNSTAAGSQGQWNLNSTNNFVGFRFLNEATNAVHYGWMQLSLGGTTGAQPRAIIGYAFENVAGRSINAGQTVVPEPSTTALLGLMAVGAVGVRAWRKRKAA
jgi:hypothetical protein